MTLWSVVNRNVMKGSALVHFISVMCSGSSGTAR